MIMEVLKLKRVYRMLVYEYGPLCTSGFSLDDFCPGLRLSA